MKKFWRYNWYIVLFIVLAVGILSFTAYAGFNLKKKVPEEAMQYKWGQVMMCDGNVMSGDVMSYTVYSDGTVEVLINGLYIRTAWENVVLWR